MALHPFPLCTKQSHLGQFGLHPHELEVPLHKACEVPIVYVCQKPLLDPFEAEDNLQ